MILVVGASGALGSAITRGLLSQGRPVRVLARSNPAYQDLVVAGAEPVPGDLKDPGSLAAACSGVETVVTTANSALRGGDDTLEAVDLRGNQDLIQAAASAGVKHFVFTSALGADASSPVPFLQAKAAAEQRLRESGMHYTILAPNIFMDVWIGMVVARPVLAGEEVVLVGEARRKHSFVAMQDVTGYALAAVGNPAAYNQYLAIGGPEPLSYRDAVATYERVLGRPIPIRSVAPGEPMPGLPPSMVALLAASETYDSPIPMEETSRLYGVPMTSLEEWVRASLSAPAPARA